jgi:nicotinamidase-related amidase
MKRPKSTIEPITHAVHLCIDMQNIFAKGGVGETPWMQRVLPAVVTLTALNPERTILARFITPETPDKRYFQRPGGACAPATRSGP